MKLRFLRTTAAANPEYPFQAGQIIVVEALSDEMRAWLADGSAELVRDDNDNELADASDVEKSVTQKGRPRR